MLLSFLLEVQHLAMYVYIYTYMLMIDEQQTKETQSRKPQKLHESDKRRLC